MHVPDWATLGVEVVCIKEFNEQGRLDKDVIIRPVMGETYTIRSILVEGMIVGLRFIEIVNLIFPYDNGVKECAFIISHFKPVLRQKREVEQELFLTHRPKVKLDAPVS